MGISQWCRANIFQRNAEVKRPVLVFVSVWLEFQFSRRKKRYGLWFTIRKNKPVCSDLSSVQDLVYTYKNLSKIRKKSAFFIFLSIRQPIQ